MTDNSNVDNLRRAAQRKSEDAARRADAAIRELIRRGDPITFRAVQRESGCSLAYLYGSEVRQRIEKLREQQTSVTPSPGVEVRESQSSVIRTLTHQLGELRARHHRETTDLREALAAAHGEILSLRRQLGTKRIAS